MKTDRVLRVMGHGEIFDLHIADLERFTGDELPNFKFRLNPKAQFVRSQTVAVDGNVQFFAKRLEALRVVCVFVR